MSFPNEEQSRVIDSPNSKLVVVAAPGTGKTSTIVARMVNLLKSNSDREISFITFTRSSRKDTQSKIYSEVGSELLDGSNIEFPRVSTLHTYAKSIIHKNAKLVGRNSQFSILIKKRGEENLILSELIDDLKLDVDLEKLSREIYHYRSKDFWHPSCTIPLDKRDQVLEHLESLQQFYNTFDLQSLVSHACYLMEKNRAKIPPILLQVDEYQDLNPVDQKFISQLSGIEGSKIVVVGDDAQSIYGFRYANLDGMRELWNSDDWESVQFKNCHRIPTHILRAALDLISTDQYLGGNVSIPEDDGKLISTLQCTTPDIQIEAVAKSITENLDTKLNSTGEKITYKDIMVLCPIKNQATKVSDSLSNDFSIPTKQIKKDIIPDDHWRLLLVLRMLEYSDSLALRQWLEIIGISNHEIAGIRSNALKASESLFQHCSILDNPDIERIYKNLNTLKENISNLDTFRDLLLEFPHLEVEYSLFSEVRITINEATAQPYSVGTVIKYVYEKYGLIDSEEENPDDDAVLVTTMHQAKGLEAEFIYIMWLNDTYIPMKGRDIREEKRVLYVALIRAKQDVILTFHERYDPTVGRRLKEEAMSPFLVEIKSHLNVEETSAASLRN